jgi:predicted transcriptional regulator
MKKIIVNMSDSTYEKLRFEAMYEKKDLRTIISERILHKQFSDSVEEAFSNFCDENFLKIVDE